MVAICRHQDKTLRRRIGVSDTFPSRREHEILLPLLTLIVAADGDLTSKVSLANRRLSHGYGHVGKPRALYFLVEAAATRWHRPGQLKLFLSLG